VGGKPAETYQWFQPTVDYAAKNGGDGFTVTLAGKPVTLVVFPSAEMAQLGYTDIQNRLIKLQQVRPTDYATVAATAAQAVGVVQEHVQLADLREDLGQDLQRVAQAQLPAVAKLLWHQPAGLAAGRQHPLVSVDVGRARLRIGGQVDRDQAAVAVDPHRLQ